MGFAYTSLWGYENYHEKSILLSNPCLSQKAGQCSPLISLNSTLNSSANIRNKSFRSLIYRYDGDDYNLQYIHYIKHRLMPLNVP